jgi:hypothetical protein
LEGVLPGLQGPTLSKAFGATAKAVDATISIAAKYAKNFFILKTPKKM